MHHYCWLSLFKNSNFWNFTSLNITKENFILLSYYYFICNICMIVYKNYFKVLNQWSIDRIKFLKNVKINKFSFFNIFIMSINMINNCSCNNFSSLLYRLLQKYIPIIRAGWCSSGNSSENCEACLQLWAMGYFWHNVGSCEGCY